MASKTYVRALGKTKLQKFTGPLNQTLAKRIIAPECWSAAQKGIQIQTTLRKKQIRQQKNRKSKMQEEWK